MTPTATEHQRQPNVMPPRLASFAAPRAADPVMRDWLLPCRDVLFRWIMGMAANADGRRAIAQMAVAVQRQRGPGEFGVWLFAAALQAALHQSDGLALAPLAGLPPELRSLLRLVAQRALRREEAMAMLHQRLGFVRSRLVQARLVCGASQPGGAAQDGKWSESVWLMNQELNECHFIKQA